MKVSYNVHRVNKTVVQATVTTDIGGVPTDVQAEIVGTEVELVCVDGHSGNITLRFIGPEAGPAQAAYSEGMTIDADFPGIVIPEDDSQPSDDQPEQS